MAVTGIQFSMQQSWNRNLSSIYCDGIS